MNEGAGLQHRLTKERRYYKLHGPFMTSTQRMVSRLHPLGILATANRLWRYWTASEAPEIVEFGHHGIPVLVGGAARVWWRVEGAAIVTLEPLGLRVPPAAEGMVPLLAEHAEWTLVARNRVGTARRSLARPPLMQTSAATECAPKLLPARPRVMTTRDAVPRAQDTVAYPITARTLNRRPAVAPVVDRTPIRQGRVPSPALHRRFDSAPANSRLTAPDDSFAPPTT